MQTSKPLPTLKVGIITLFKDMFSALDFSITGRAQEKNQLHLHHFDPRDFGENKHGFIDDRPYGGGPGMVMMAQPLKETINYAKKQLGENTLCVYLSPQGKTITQATLNAFVASEKPLLLLAGRYEGVDERVIEQHIDEEWSIGDMVVSGGELPAMLVIDAMVRLLPGVLGHKDSAKNDSFMQGLLDCPHYTRPEILDGKKVPKVLLSGNHKAIEQWRKKQALGRTWLRRQDLLESKKLSQEEVDLLNEFKNEMN